MCQQCKSSYGFWHFCWDLFLICATGGLWGIWLILKALHNSSN